MVSNPPAPFPPLSTVLEPVPLPLSRAGAAPGHGRPAALGPWCVILCPVYRTREPWRVVLELGIRSTRERFRLKLFPGQLGIGELSASPAAVVRDPGAAIRWPGSSSPAMVRGPCSSSPAGARGAPCRGRDPRAVYVIPAPCSFPCMLFREP
jgi:hypothetical protein